MRRVLVRQGFRLYVLLLAIWGVWTIAWATNSVRMAPMAVAGGWLTIAGVGVLLIIGLLVTKNEAFGIENPAQRKRHERFTATWFNRPLLNLYAIVLIAWSGPTLLWWSTRGGILDATVVGMGWYAIAVIGAIVTIGLVVTTLETPIDLVSDPAERRR